MASLEAGPACPAAGFSPPLLAPIYLFARQLREREGLPVAETLAGLAEHFQVADVSDLPESAWPAVLAWFESLLIG